MWRLCARPFFCTQGLREIRLWAMNRAYDEGWLMSFFPVMLILSPVSEFSVWEICAKTYCCSQWIHRPRKVVKSRPLSSLVSRLLPLFFVNFVKLCNYIAIGIREQSWNVNFMKFELFFELFKRSFFCQSGTHFQFWLQTGACRASFSQFPRRFRGRSGASCYVLTVRYDFCIAFTLGVLLLISLRSKASYFI